MLWSSGVASEVIRPMAAPVMGGILVADEVIDLLLPVLFYWVRRLRWQRLHAGSDPTPPGDDAVTVRVLIDEVAASDQLLAEPWHTFHSSAPPLGPSFRG
jgi:hypothetical protein